MEIRVYTRQDCDLKGKPDIFQDTVVVEVGNGDVNGYGESQSSPSMVSAIIAAPASRVLRAGIPEILAGVTVTGDIAETMAQMRDVTRILGREGVVVHALSAIEQALWDAQARNKEVPLWSAISPDEDPQHGPALYGTLWCPTSEEKCFDLGRRARASGLAGIKVAYSVGLLDPVVERSRLFALRSGLGEDRSIMVDWQTRGSLVELIERLPGYQGIGVRWVEEPFDREDFSSYEQAAGISEIPLAAGESETRLLGFQRLADAGVRVLQPDLGRCGGLLAAMDVARLAQRLGIDVVPHSWSTAIIDAVNLHWAIACKLDLIETPFDGRKIPDMVGVVDYENAGHLAVPLKAGLGIDVDLDGYIETDLVGGPH